MKFLLKNKKLNLVIATLAFIALGFLPFIFNLNDQFVSDDWDFLHLTANSDQPLYSYFFSNYYGENSGGSYRPMVNVFWSVGYNFFGLNSFGYHFLNIAFHTLNIFLIFLIVKNLPWFRREKRKILAWLSAIIFAVLPNHSAAVSWISVVNDTMMTNLFLLSLLFFLFSYKKQRFSKLYYVFSLVSCALSLLTKEMGITLPAILGIFVLYDLFKNQDYSLDKIKNAVFYLTPYAFLVILFFIIRYFSIGLLFDSYVGSTHLSYVKVVRSISSMFFSNFFTDSLRMLSTGFFYSNYLAAPIAVCCIFILLILTGKERKWPAFPFFLLVAFLISLIPVLQFTVNYTPAYINQEGARYAYLPSVFIAVLVAYIFQSSLFYIKKRGKILRFAGILFYFFILLFFTFQLVGQNMKWDKSSKLANKAIEDVVSVYEKENPDGVVLVGTPDSYRGAFILRNAIDLAVNFKLDNFNSNSILVTRNRTKYSPNQSFGIRREGRSFVYRENQKKKLIVSQPVFSSSDYKLELKNREFNRYALSHRNFGNKLKIEFTEKFVENNRDMNIWVLFYDNNKWIKHKL